MASAMGLGWPWKPREQKRCLPAACLCTPNSGCGCSVPCPLSGTSQFPTLTKPPQEMSSPFGKSCVSSGRTGGPEFSLEGRVENAGCLVGGSGERKQTLRWVLTGPVSLTAMSH